jgi:DNA-binding NarL/FixJ family response regulator
MRCEEPQLLRALGLHSRAAGDLANARERLQASAESARSQHAVVQLGRTLAVLGEVARALGDSGVASAADAERAQVVARIGPAVRGLNWTKREAAAATRSFAEQGQSLTRREDEVAALVARGMTNSQIARVLVITDRTVAAHIEHINNKLGFTSRTQIGVWAAHRPHRQFAPHIGDSADSPPTEQR